MRKKVWGSAVEGRNAMEIWGGQGGYHEKHFHDENHELIEWNYSRKAWSHLEQKEFRQTPVRKT